MLFDMYNIYLMHENSYVNGNTIFVLDMFD